MEGEIKIPAKLWSKFKHRNCRISIMLQKGIIIQHVWVDVDGTLLGQPVHETKDTVFSLSHVTFPENEIVAIKRDNGFLALIGLRQWVFL